MSHLLESDEWQQEMADLFLDVYESKIQHLVADDNGESDDDTREEAIIEFVSDCPTNIKIPNFGSWGTVDDTSEVVVDYWLAW